MTLDTTIITGIVTIVAIIAHHEILAVGDGNRPESPGSGKRGCGHYRMPAAGQSFDPKSMPRRVQGGEFVVECLGHRFVFDPPAVEDQLIIRQFDAITRY